MSALNTQNATDTLNQVAVEVGLLPVADPMGSTEDHFIQLKYLMNTAGRELLLAHPWEASTRRHSFTTDGGGEYDLPDDYLYMINQTGWDGGNDAPLAGPLSPQEWVYSSNLIAIPLRVMFRIQDGVLTILNDTAGAEVSFEYHSRNWVFDGSVAPATYHNEITKGTQVPLFDQTVFSRYLKVKWLDAKGFDSSKAQDDFNQMFDFVASKDKGARILNAGASRGGVRLLNAYNVPDTGIGL